MNFNYFLIQGAKAQFKGYGKITNGTSGIAFIMTVIDGELDGTGVDKVRMKIYNKNTSFVIYDNMPGASDVADPVPIVGSNITGVIQNTNISPLTVLYRLRRYEQLVFWHKNLCLTMIRKL